MTGERLKAWRKGRFTQRELSKILDVHEDTIANWESGRQKIPQMAYLAIVALTEDFTEKKSLKHIDTE